MKAAPALTGVDWDAAAARADRDDPILSASLHSLAALFADGFDKGIPSIRRAQDIEPFNPLHTVRAALFHARFGDLGTADRLLQGLQRYELQAPIIPYLRALLLLRGGRADQARAIAGSIEARHPDFALGKFLRAEAQVIMAANASKLERHLRGLPSGEKWDACWADLLIKLTLLHPKDGTALAARYDKRAGNGTPVRAALDKAINWVSATIESLAEALGGEPPGSRSEALLLECLADKLETLAGDAATPPHQAIRMLAAIQARYPERNALRQILHSFNTRRAAADAAHGRFEEALRFTERSLAEMPYDLVYYQNRAALFTLMREPSAYHDAWEALNTHQYRLLLLGVGGPVIEQVIKTHRVFAQQSRGGIDRLSKGLFHLILPEEGAPYLRLNEDAIAVDPDLLRQWFHHKRAELVFRHMALGDDPSTMLLAPQDRDEAMTRAEALDHIAQSLPVLVAEEGGKLADALSAHWKAAALTIRTRYLAMAAEPPADEPQEAEAEAEARPENEAGHEHEGLRELREEHLSTLGDLCLVAWAWQPQHEHVWIAEELLAWLPAQVAFASVSILAPLQERLGGNLPYPLRVLASATREQGGGGGGSLKDFSNDHFRAAVDAASTELLRGMAVAAYYGSHGTNRDRAPLAMEYIDRARALRPNEAKTELTAAELLSLGEYFDEARRSLDRFRHLVSSDDQGLIDRASRTEEALEEHRRKGEKGHSFTEATPGAIPAEADARRVSDLLVEIDESPTSWRLYAALVKELVLVGRMDEAIEWADRCVSRCLGRSEQISARTLAMEARGLRTMAAENPRAAKLYAVGAYEAARRAVETLAGAGTTFDVSLHYLLGRCQLETGAPDAASASFQAAFDQCGQSIYRPVLRRLTEDIDQAYLAVARGTVDARIKDGEFDEAIAESCRVLSRLKKPEAWLVDMARMFCAVAMGRTRDERSAGAMPDIDLGKLDVPWRARLAAALRSGDDVERCIAIASLAKELDPAAAPRAGTVIERAEALRRQIAATAALGRIGQLLAQRSFDQTLSAIDGLDPTIATEPRLRRMHVLALLGAHRFQEADEMVATFGQANSADIREFLASYPSFVFRQRIALAHKLLRDGKADEALALIDRLTAPSPKEDAELAYCKAFAATLEGYNLRKHGNKRGANQRFEEALMLLEPHMRQPTTAAHLTELYERLDTEVEQRVG